MDTETANLSAEQLLGILRRRVPWILLCVILVAGVAFGFSRHQTKMYTTTASIVFGSNPLSQQIAGFQGSSGGGTPLAQQASNLELVRLGDMAAKTATSLGQGLTEAKVIESLSISGQGESNTVDVTATADSPVLAAKIATTYVNQFVAEQQKDTQQFLSSALAILYQELGDFPEARRTVLLS